MDNSTLKQARQNLIQIGLIAYQKPLYQVLALDNSTVVTEVVGERSSSAQPHSLGQIFRKIMEDSS
jgi:hypothetical protein